MKSLATFILLSTALILSAFGEHIKGNGKVEERKQNLDHFSSIDLSGMFEVGLIEGDEKIEVVIDENLHEHINIAVKNDELIIDTRDKYFDAEQVLLHIYYRAINEIDVLGAVSLNIENQLQTDHFSLDVSGSCQGNLNVAVEDLEIEISDGGERTLSGEAHHLNIDVYRALEIKALDLKVQEADLQIPGAGEIELSIENRLNVEVTRAGEVRYSGDPTISKSVTGAGEITQIKI